MSAQLTPKESAYVMEKIGDAIMWIAGDMALPPNGRSDHLNYAVDRLTEAIRLIKRRKEASQEPTIIAAPVRMDLADEKECR